jgi:lysine 2,3-aminomutase
VHARKILQKLLDENPTLEKIIRKSKNVVEIHSAMRSWIIPILKRNPVAEIFYKNKEHTKALTDKLNWQDLAAIRILDYIDHAGQKFPDQNIGGVLAKTAPFKALWLAAHKGTGGAKAAFFNDMLQLFRQLNGTQLRELPDKKKVKRWMKRYPSGLDPKVIELRETNQKRIIKILIAKIDNGEIASSKYNFQSGDSYQKKEKLMNQWWRESNFHLQFAIRSPELLNEMLDYTLNDETMRVLKKARKKGIPFFVNPYYLSLLNAYIPDYVVGADLAIRSYVIYSKHLVEEFGNIVAWEKEDKVKPGKPNIAGWMLPSHNIHRRYPEVAIFIPDTVGRACGGLCASCQRMYNFQSGRHNFNLEKLKPEKSWNTRLPELLDYFKNDSQLRDILITGGDALMSSNQSLKRILDETYKMAKAKKEENKTRSDKNKYAEIVRIRIGTRLPVYLPQRITPELTEILSQFKSKALKIGIRQFVVQTHFQSPMEVTSESQRAIELLQQSGWAVTNQQVFTATASRRGHSAKLRKVLNKIGVLSYYTFTVKGFTENKSSFAPNSRSMQERVEEKIFGTIPADEMDLAQNLLLDPQHLVDNIKSLRKKTKLPFLSTDRSILNLPGVGKSMTFRTVGITRYGRRILEFDHDPTRRHSPIIKKMGKVIVIEPKSIDEYLKQLLVMGEKPKEYANIYGYSIGQTEARMAMYEYPKYDYEVTKEFTNLEI